MEPATTSTGSTKLSFAPALATAVLFSIMTVIHIVLASRTRKLYAWVLIMGAIWETAAFGLRALDASGRQQQQQQQQSQSQSKSQALAAAHLLLHLLAPAWIAAFVYRTFARQVWYWTPDQRVGPLHAYWLAKVLVPLDLSAFALQFLGAALVIKAGPGPSSSAASSASSPDARHGLALHLAGLALQLALVVVFAALLVAWHVKMAAYEADQVPAPRDLPGAFRPRSWKGLQAAVYLVVALVAVRVAFHTVQFSRTLSAAAGAGAETLHYLLDPTPTLLCLLVLAVAHPGRFLVGRDSELPTCTDRRREAKEARELQARKEAAFGKGPKETIADQYWGASVN